MGDAVSQENVEIVRSEYASFGQLAESGDVRSWVPVYFDSIANTGRLRRSTRFAVTRH